jgi:2-C-methyl-D-erythritol 4-phosphate cytidylyltransferase
MEIAMPKVEQDVLAIVPIASSIHDHRLILTLSGRTVLDWTLTALQAVPRVASIVVAPECNVSSEVRAVVRRYAVGHPIQVIESRAGRMAAIGEALHLTSSCKRVLIHDPDRPLLSGAQLTSMLAHAAGAPVAIPAVQLKSTFKHVRASQVEATVPRDRLVRVQSPRIFERRVLEQLVTVAAEQGWEGDELSLVRRAQINVQLLPGDYFNIPLSDRLDVEFVELAINRHVLPAFSG